MRSLFAASRTSTMDVLEGSGGISSSIPAISVPIESRSVACRVANDGGMVGVCLPDRADDEKRRIFEFFSP